MSRNTAFAVNSAAPALSAFEWDLGGVTFTAPIRDPHGVCSMATISEQLQTYRSSLAAAQANGDEVIARRVEQQIRELEAFQQRHPEESEAPSPFEVFCDLNPSDTSCLVYDD
jgi:hypothetical protein